MAIEHVHVQHHGEDRPGLSSFAARQSPVFLGQGVEVDRIGEDHGLHDLAHQTVPEDDDRGSVLVRHIKGHKGQVASS